MRQPRKPSNEFLSTYFSKIELENSERQAFFTFVKKKLLRRGVRSCADLLNHFPELSDSERFGASLIFMMAKYRRSVSMMYDQLFSKSHELSGIAAACLSSIGGDRIAEKLLVELSVPQCPTETKVAIMSCLSSLKSHNFRTRIAARLLLVLKDKNEKRQLREAAAYGLSGVLRDVGKSRKIYRNAVRSLAFALLDPSPCLRGNAVFSLGSLRAKEYRKRLEAISRTDHAKCYGPADKGTAWTVAKEAKVALRKIDQEPATSQ